MSKPTKGDDGSSGALYSDLLWKTRRKREQEREEETMRDTERN